jgi:hypothetical protein
LWYYVVFVILCGLCDTMWSLWYDVVFVIRCGLCDTMWSLWYYVVFVIRCGLCDTMWSLWYYAVFSSGSESLLVFIVCLYLHCYWRSNYQESRVRIPLTGVTAATLCACPQLGSVYLMLYVVVFFLLNDLRWEVIFVDIGRIVDHLVHLI